MKNLKLFKLQTFFVSSYGALLVIAFISLWLGGKLLLNWVGVAYIVIALINTITGLIIFAKNKKYPINFLHKVKIKFTKKEFSTIFYLAFSEIVWQIGYMLTAVFLLKMSELYFNTYSYYENVLDIFNNFYFSFIIIVSIEITRSLGEKKFNEAYQHGKYSIYFSIFIWLIYALASIILLVPINKGLNPDLQAIGTVSLFLYVALHLPRFLVWNLSTYILVWGGQVKIQFVLEMLSTIYYIILVFIYPYLPSGIYWAYFFIAIDYIIKLPIELYIFKSKTWLINVNEEESSPTPGTPI